MVQWVRFCSSNTGSAGSIPGWGAKIPLAKQYSQKIKIKKEREREKEKKKKKNNVKKAHQV